MLTILIQPNIFRIQHNISEKLNTHVNDNSARNSLENHIPQYLWVEYTFSCRCMQPKARDNGRPFGQGFTALCERQIGWQVSYQDLSISGRSVRPIKLKLILRRKGLRKLRLFPVLSKVLNEWVFLFKMCRGLSLSYLSSREIIT